MFSAFIMALLFNPLLFSFSLLGYTPLILPAPQPVSSDAGVISGCTILYDPLNSDMRPNTIYSISGLSFSSIHFMPLKKTSSMAPVGSLNIMESRFDLGVAPIRAMRVILPLICIYAVVG